MKKLLAIAICVLVAVSGCKKVKSITEINKDIPYDQDLSLIAVDTSLAGLPLPAGGMGVNFPATPLPSNSETFFTQYNTSPDKIISAKLKKLNLILPGASAPNFDFADTIRLFLSAKALPEVLIAYTNNVPKGKQGIELTTVDINLKEYFLKDTFYFREYVHFNAIPGVGSTVSIRSVWNLVANPLN